MIRTVSNLEVLLHYHVSAEEHPRIDAPAVKEGLKHLEITGMVERVKNTFVTTEKARVYIAYLLEAPFPEKRYVMPSYTGKQ